MNIHWQSAKTNLNVEQVFYSIARDIKQRLADTDSKAEVINLLIVYTFKGCMQTIQVLNRPSCLSFMVAA